MFQDFTSRTCPDDGAPRLASLRAVMAAEGLAGYLVPRADAYQGEYVAPHDDRLAWLTGFTGSAGFAVVLADRAGVFIDGRYRVQVRSQIDLASFTPVHWPETKPGAWLRDALASGAKVGGAKVGFDPWLHSQKEIDDLKASLEDSGISLCPVRNLIDAIWPDQPAPPAAPAFAHPLEFAGEDSASKRARLAQGLRDSGARAAVTHPCPTACAGCSTSAAPISRATRWCRVLRFCTTPAI